MTLNKVCNGTVRASERLTAQGRAYLRIGAALVLGLGMTGVAGCSSQPTRSNTPVANLTASDVDLASLDEPATLSPAESTKSRAASRRARRGGGRYKVGKPYQIKGRWYHPRKQPDYDKVGRASWYGPGFHGRKTANGETYDMHALTAAHPTLPLPSLVKVRNLANGREVLVRVNDRGPYARNRVIDLSKTAAKALGFHHRGVAKVRVTYVGKAPLDGDQSAERKFLESQSWYGTRVAGLLGDRKARKTRKLARTQAGTSVSSAQGRSASGYFVHAGTFRNADNARRLRSSLGAIGPTRVHRVGEDGAPLYRVQVGPFPESATADDALRLVRLAGMADAMLVAQ